MSGQGEGFQAVTGTADAVLIQPPDFRASQDASSEVLQSGNAVYEYRNSGKINGICVSPADRDLPIDRDDVLDFAFDLVSSPKAAVFEIGTDGSGLDAYTEALDRIYGGTALKLDEERRFDPESRKFIIWLRYDEVEYRLNGRYKYLKDEIK